MDTILHCSRSILVAFTGIVVNVDRAQAHSLKGIGGWGLESQVRVNAVIVGAANMTLPQSHSTSTEAVTESLDNEQLKQEAETDRRKASAMLKCAHIRGDRA